MIVNKCHDLFSSISREIITALAFVIGLVFLGGNIVSSAATTDDHPATVSRTMWLTGEPINGGPATTLYTSSSTDSSYGNNSSTGNDNIIHPVNLDKYKNLIVNYSVKNISSQSETLEAILEFSGYNDNYLLSYDPSRADEASLTTDPASSAIKTACSYQDNAGQYTDWDSRDKTAGLYAMYMGGTPNSLAKFDAGQKVTMSAPVKVSSSYDFSNAQDQNSYSDFRDSTFVTDLTHFNGLKTLTLYYRPFKSIVLKNDSHLTAANYADLKQAADENVQALFDDYAQEDTTTSKASIVNIEPDKTGTPGTYEITYKYDGVTKTVTGATTDKSGISAKDFTVSYGSNWDSEKFNGLTAHTDANGNSVSPLSKDVTTTIQHNGQTVDSVDTSNAGAVYDVTYALSNGISQTVHVTVGPNTNGGGNGGNGSNTINVPSTNTPVSNNNNSSTTTSSSSSQTNGNTTNVPNYVAVKGSAVYAVKPIYMYRNANFKKSQRIARYLKAKRVNRPMFVVTGYQRANNGALRYKVRDVNHGKKTAGKVGYITANRKYVVNVYYKTMPKNKKITVISKKGIYAYKNANQTRKAKAYKKGTHLTVKKIVKHNLTTRYQLSNGNYVTANKKLVIQGSY